MSTPDISQLSAAQQEALQTYTGVTDQDPLAAISLLQRCEWNVQIAIARFFDGEPTRDALAEARAQAIPAPSSRETTNLQYESFASRPAPRPDAVNRVDTTTTTTPAYRVPFLLTPFTILFRLFSTVLSPLSFLVPSFLSRIIRNILTVDSRPSRRQLPPADTAHRFIREFEETYTPNPPLPFAATGFNLTLDNCKKESKFLLVVLISPTHDDTHGWIRETLLSSQVHQFLQTHQHEVVLWGGSVQDAEGYQVSSVLNCTKFPFAALICETNEGRSDMSVVMRAAGPLPPAELVAKLASAMNAQQAQLAATRAQRAEQQASRSLRQEQDSAYERSLAQDRERAQRKREEEEAKAQAEKAATEAAEREEMLKQNRDQWRRWRASKILPEAANDSVRLSIRMADGNRVIRKFSADASLEELYAFVECYDLLSEVHGDGDVEKPANYEHQFGFQLVSPMPRTVIDMGKGGSIIERVGKGGTLVVEEIDSNEEALSSSSLG